MRPRAEVERDGVVLGGRVGLDDRFAERSEAVPRISDIHWRRDRNGREERARFERLEAERAARTGTEGIREGSARHGGAPSRSEVESRSRVRDRNGECTNEASFLPKRRLDGHGGAVGGQGSIS